MAQADRTKDKTKRDREIEELLQTPDQFVTFWQRLLNRLLPHMVSIIVTMLLVFVVAGIGWGINQIFIGRRERASEMLGRAVRTYEADLLKDSDVAPDEDEIPRYKTAKERSEGALAQLDKLNKEYGSSNAALRGSLVRAGILFELGRYDEARAAYQGFLDKKPENPAMEAVAREGLGLCAEAQGKLDEALTHFKDDNTYYKDRMLFAQARVFLKKGDKKKAGEIYKDILAKVPETPLKDEIGNRMLALED